MMIIIGSNNRPLRAALRQGGLRQLEAAEGPGAACGSSSSSIVIIIIIIIISSSSV